MPGSPQKPLRASSRYQARHASSGKKAGLGSTWRAAAPCCGRHGVTLGPDLPSVTCPHYAPALSVAVELVPVM